MKLLVTHQFEFQGEDFPAGVVVDVNETLGAAILKAHGDKVRGASIAAEPQPQVRITTAPVKPIAHKR